MKERFRVQARSGRPTPSMDNKGTPSPPVMTTELYERCKAAGVIRGGKPQDSKSVKEERQT